MTSTLETGSLTLDASGQEHDLLPDGTVRLTDEELEANWLRDEPGPELPAGCIALGGCRSPFGDEEYVGSAIVRAYD